MDDHFNTACAKPLHGLFKTGKRVTSPDVCSGLFVDGLQSQLDPDRFDLIQFEEERKDILRQTVRTGSDGKRSDIRMCDGLFKNMPEMGDRCIGIGIGLEIGDVFSDRAFGTEQ